MTKDEALRMALEALEEPHPGIRTSFTDAITYREKVKQAITALKAALAQPKQNEFNPDWDAMAVMVEEQQRMAKRISELEAQQAPVEHPPCKGMNCGITRTDQEHSMECQAEHAAAIAGGHFVKPEQEPVALEDVYLTIIQWDVGGGKRSRRELARRIVAKYTTPPQRKPLTDEEALDMARTFGAQPWPPGSCVAFARAVEAAHGIKE